MPHQSDFHGLRLETQVAVFPDAVVYRATRLADAAPVEVALLSRETGADRRAALLRRARILQAIRHDALQNVLAVDVSPDRSAVVLETSRGVSLSRGWKSGPLAMRMPADTLGVIKGFLSAVTKAHCAGLAHGGLSPETIRIDNEDRLQINFCRFDVLVHDPSDALPYAAFVAPEVCMPLEATFPSDIFSTAALIVWLTLGSFDGRAPSRDVLVSALGTTLPNRLDVDAAADALLQALSTEPEDRGSLRDLIERFSGRPVARSADVAARESGFDDFEATRVDPQATGRADETRIQDSESVASAAESFRRMQVEQRGTVGRYRILKKLGAGGMGAVYQAEDPADGRIVAVKVLAPEIAARPESLRRFRKEARLLSEVRHPNVTNLLDVNEDDGIHYLVMEFVAGNDLRTVLRDSAPLPESRALELIADVSRALQGAHELGIVHRDIKPANILLADDQVQGSGDERSSAQSPVKLTDFGLARHIDQSESMQMTKAGALLGTPYYMSPEQCSGRGEVTPATDVYALGVTLFELLTGRVPFDADDPMKLVAKHCFDDVPSLQKLNPAVSDEAVRIVEKALAKSPADRYADAGSLLRELERCLRGEPADIRVHPLLPEHDGDAEIYENEFTWEFAASCHDFWPLVSNTERVNEAMGLPPVEYSTRRDDAGRLQRYGHVRLAGFNIEWIEHPFEWVEGQRHGVLREFTRGPFLWFQSIVELSGNPSGGTRLSHRIRIQPRNLVGSLIARREIGGKARKSLDRVYRRIDQVLANRGAGSPLADPFTAPPRLTRAQRARLDLRVDELRTSAGATQIVDAVAGYIREAPSQEISRIRPLALARRLNSDPEGTVDTLLHAVKCGLLELYWDILCPTCRISSGTADTLREIENHGRCDVCDLDFDVDFSNSIEMVFRAHPEIRPVDVATYCAGGPGHSPHVIAQVRLGAGEFLELATSLDEGDYILRSPHLPYTLAVVVRSRGGVTHATVPLSPQCQSREIPTLRAGRQSLSLASQYDREVLLRLERAVFRKDAFTAAQAASSSLFRELFPDEVLGPGKLLRVSTVTLLAFEFCEVPALLEESGDARAYEILRSAAAQVSERIAHHGGAVIRLNDGRFLASFQDAANAVPAVLEAAQRLAEPQFRDAPGFRAALHRGPALVTTSDGHLDYFGRSVCSVLQLIQRANRTELWMHESVGADPAVAEILQRHQLPASVHSLEADQGPRVLAHRVRLDALGTAHAPAAIADS